MVRILSLIIFLAAGVFTHAQSAAELETFLEVRELSHAQAARFVLQAADISPAQGTQGWTEEEAFDYCLGQEWFSRDAAPADPVRLDRLSRLIMGAFNFKGGIFYSLFKNAHYSYRELVHRQIIQGKSDPARSVSGEQLLAFLGKILTTTEQTAEAQKAAEERRRLEEAERRRLAAEINARLSEHAVQNTRAEAGSAGVVINLSNIQFQANSAEMLESEYSKIEEIAAILKTLPGRRILVAGHTALAGTEEERRSTSLARAQAVADYLIRLGARSRREITVQGFGAERPVADNNTAAGQALNRRVEITILDEGVR
jgi:outer membrane protein OmpA-like peptidoglycan-associated protein